MAIQLKVRDIVRCSRIGKGEFRVIDIRHVGSHNEEVRLESLDNPNIILCQWIYSVHCDTRSTFKNRLSNRRGEVEKILNKKRKY